VTTSGPSVWEKYQDLLAENSLLKSTLDKGSLIPQSQSEARVKELEDAISEHRRLIATGNMIKSYKTAHAANHSLWAVLGGTDGER
jgi:hypothetical protein